MRRRTIGFPLLMIAGVLGIGAWVVIFFHYSLGRIHNIAIAGAVITAVTMALLARAHRQQHEMITVVLVLSLLSLGLGIVAMAIAIF